MPLRKNRDSSTPLNILGMTLMRWLLLIISLIVGAGIDAAFFEAIKALAQKAVPDSPPFMWFLQIVVIGAAASSIFALLNLLVGRISGSYR